MSTGVADGIADVTPSWLSAALGTEVTEVDVTRVGTGQIGATYRLTITYAAGSSGPASLIAKFAAEDVAARSMVAEGYRKEVGFYTEIVSTVDVHAPACRYGAISADGSSFTLLLDDLAPARAGIQAEGCTLAQASGAVRNLAGLHAPRWGDETLERLGYAARAKPEEADFIGALHVDATESFLRRYRDALGAEDQATLRASAAATAGWLLARPEPFSLIHGDYRLDNLMFHPDGAWVAALDWQTLSLGPPVRDLAYFLGTSLPVEARRAHEASLVREYHDELLRRGVTGYGAERCAEDYHLGLLHGPLITVLGCEYATAMRGPESDAMFLAMATRCCAAIRDHDPLRLLGC